jgi:hypothetical protein
LCLLGDSKEKNREIEAETRRSGQVATGPTQEGRGKRLQEAAQEALSIWQGQTHEVNASPSTIASMGQRTTFAAWMRILLIDLFVL